jgi:hypothetical protein
MRPARVKLVLGVLTALALDPAPRAAPESGAPLREYEIKAAFLFNFARFVEWPGAGAGGMLVLAVLGDDPFGEALDPLEAREIMGRRVVVRRYRGLDELEPCDLLFVSASLARDLDHVIARVGHAPTLIVGDADGFLDSGGMIGLYVTSSKRVRFEIDAGRAEAVGLRVSSKLLSLARPRER